MTPCTLGPILANIFVLWETTVQQVTSALYLFTLRDDTFAYFSSCNEVLSFFHCLNVLHFSLTFTMDEEKGNKLSFLDVLVEYRSFVFVTCIYRKPTFTGLLLSWDAFAPKSWKVNLIKCLTFRVLKIFRITRLKVNIKKFKFYFRVMGILRRSLLTPLKKLFISLGITSSHLALLNAQFMLNFLGLDLP